MSVPPHNLEAEENVLGAMIAPYGGDRAITEVSEILSPQDFYRESHGTIYKAILDLSAAGEPVDPITLADYMQRNQTLERAGGSARLAELAALTPSTSNAAHYAKIVANEAARRSLVLAGQHIVRSAQEGGDAADLIAEAESHLSKATSLRNTTRAEPLAVALPDYRAELLHAYQNKQPMFGMKTGFPDLDSILLGFWPGQLIVVAARPGQGKSAFALNVAENFADAGLPSFTVSLEMSSRELLIRSIARASKIDGKRLQLGTIEEEHLPQLREGLKTVEDRKELMLIDDNGSMTLPALRAEAIRLQRQYDIKLIVLDYLQLMSGPETNTNDRVAAITRGLKQLARQLNIPVLALSQMSRAIESRSEKRPQLSDLRDSGAIEQDADVVMFLHDDAAYDHNTTGDGTIELIVAKNRKGAAGTVKLLFLRRFTTFKTPTKTPGGDT